VTPRSNPEPGLADVQREYPRWDCRRGTSGLYAATLRGSAPPVTVQGEDPADLRDMIIRAESELEREEAGTRPRDRTAGPGN